MATLNNSVNRHISEEEVSQFPHWYSPETGICHSKHASRKLPSDPFLDVVSFIFSNQQNGVSALIDSSTGSSLSYSELHHLVQSMASGLHSIGISKSDVVLVLLPNSIYYPVILLGVLYLGAIVTTMNPLSSVTEIKKQVSDSKACLAFTIPEKVEVFQVLGVTPIEVPENFNLGLNSSRFSAFSKLVSGYIDLVPRSLIKQQDAAAIMYSSGTTGVSKGVVLTHRNFIAMVELFVRFEASQYEYSSLKNVYLATLPMFHIYGLSLFVMGLLSLGSTIVVMRRFNINEVVKAIDRFHVTHFPVVPPILTALTRTAKDLHGRSFRSLKQVSSGAAPLSKKIIEDFVETFPDVDFIQGYGMTESTAVGTRGFNTKKFQNFSSVGLLAPNMQAKVVDWTTGAFLPPGCSGELWLRGPAVMKGYLNNAVATMSTIDKDGWLHTGDIVFFDQDGFLHIIDRLKEIIKYKGFQIAPADLEAVLISHPEIQDVAVAAVKDENSGEIPVAFVVKKHGSSLSQEAVMDYVAGQVAPYKKIRKVVFTHSIPKSAAGKILRRELGKLLISRL
ncbi:4-coumarate-CoA ligase [Parasponia andersonii]|uniref:4-coumarate--CoA ligase n=1 Tax=Parasponia andersonii TaxID=3476 RepID=A0A2P5AZ24_PARAD|nr:4-coumarate-CoA ligase [Parasponia andersonii]